MNDDDLENELQELERENRELGERLEANQREMNRRWGIPPTCDWCGVREDRCTCDVDDALFDADELGLDPEEDAWPRSQ